MKKDGKSKGGTCEGGCGVCKCCYWLFPVLIALVALVPSWHGSMWAKWLLVIIAVLILLKRKCPCNK